MIDVNLLPDSKLKRLKEKRTKQITISLSTLVILGSIGAPVVLFISDFALRQAIESKQGNIDKLVKKFENKEDVQRMLTVQSQLKGLPAAEKNRYFASNLLTLIEHTTPPNVSLSSVTVINDEGAFEIEAQASTVAEANNFIESLDAITIIDPDDKERTISPFDGPVVETFSDDNNEPVTFSVEGEMNVDLGSVEDIAELITQPFKLELDSERDRRIKISPSEDE